MKKLSFIVTTVFVFCLNTGINAQSYILYGTTQVGGTYNQGTLFSFNLATNNDSILYNFSTQNGTLPLSGVVLDSLNGFYYGGAQQGGQYDSGAIYSYNGTSGQYSIVHSFNRADGAWPFFNDFSFYNGLFYGMTTYGGKYNQGVIFNFNPTTNTYQTLLNFHDSGGAPALTQSVGFYRNNNIFYGITWKGGTSDEGTIFQYNPATNTDSVIISFNGLNGANPINGVMTLDPNNGLLYGTTSNGGANGDGVIFSFNMTTGQESVVYNFDETHGSNPYTDLLYNPSNGLLYGTTIHGGTSGEGVLYSLDPNSGAVTVLVNTSSATGWDEIGDMTLGPCGVIYGILSVGGTYNKGTLYSYVPATNTFTVLHNFGGTGDGGIPLGKLAVVSLNNSSVSSLPQAPQVSVSASANNVCSGTSVTLTASGASTYLWNTGATTSSINVMPNNTTIYNITGSGNNGCSVTLADTVSIATPTVTVTPSTATVNTGVPVQFVASGANTYSWTPATGLNATTGNTVTATVTTNTIYTVTGTSTQGCTGTQTASIIITTAPTIFINPPAPTICDGNSVKLTASGGKSYSWSTGQKIASITVSPASTTTYTVSGTVNGQTVSQVVTVTVNPLPTIAALSPASICSGNSITLSETANNQETYTWSPATGLNNTTSASVVATPTATTSYSVAVSLNGCTSSSSAKITVNASPSIKIAGNESICSGDSTKLTASGAGTGGTYIWNTGSTSASIYASQSNPMIVLKDGSLSYMVTGTNSNGCSNNAEASVIVNTTPMVTISANQQAICKGTSDVLTANGANTYLWSTGGTYDSITVTPTATKTYSVTGYGQGNCSSKATYQVIVNAVPNISITGKDTVCNGDSTKLTATDGGSGATYIWNTGATTSSIYVTPTFLRLLKGSNNQFTVIGTNGIGCSDTATVKIVGEPSPAATLTSSSQTLCKGNSDTLIVAPSFFAPPGTTNNGLTFKWSTGSTNDTIIVSPTASHTYSVTEIGADGCKATATDSINVNDCGPGYSCGNAIDSHRTPVEISDSATPGSIKWYSFTADSSYEIIQLNSYTANTIQSISLYSSCQGNLLAEAFPAYSIKSVVDSFIIHDSLLSNNTRYYLEVVAANCNDCGIEAPFSLNIHKAGQLKTLNLQNLYSQNGCGINYVIGYVPIHGRSNISDCANPATTPTNTNPPTGTGSITFAPTGTNSIPNGSNIIKAYVLWSVVGYSKVSAATGLQHFTFTNSTGNIYNTTALDVNALGAPESNEGTCWQDYDINNTLSVARYFSNNPYTGGYVYDVTNWINATSPNGTYTISNLPYCTDNEYIAGNGAPDAEGATLIIVYQEPCATYTGNFNLDTGFYFRGSNTMAYSGPITAAPANAANGSAFFVLGDIEVCNNSVGNSDNWSMSNTNNPTNTFSADQANLWSTVISPATYNSGQTTVSASILTNNDCYNMFALGSYYQIPMTSNTSCFNTLTITQSNPYTCAGSPITLSASGAANYTWSDGETTSSITVSPSSTTVYTVTGTSKYGCVSVGTTTVNVTSIAINGTKAVCEDPSTMADYYLTAFGSTLSGFNCTNPTYRWTLPQTQSPSELIVAGGLTNPTLDLYVLESSPFGPAGFTISLEVCCEDECCSQSFTIGGCCYNLGPIDISALIDAYTIDLPTSSYSAFLQVGSTYSLTGINSTNPNAANQNPLVIDGTFTVNTPLVLNQCDVEIGTNGEIVIEPGMTLTINNCHLHACDEMWQGIIVEPGGKVTINNSLIEDAINGVTTEGNAECAISGSDFNKNHVGINYGPYNGLHLGSVESSFFRCYDDSYNFTTNTITYGTNQSTLLPPYSALKTLAGISVTNVTRINFGVAGSTNMNTFDNLDCGILDTASGVSMANNTFQNITQSSTSNSTGQFAGVAVVDNLSWVPRNMIVGQASAGIPNNFTNCTYGVLFKNNTKLTAKVCNNIFKNNSFAVSVSNFNSNTQNTSCNFNFAQNTISNTSSYLSTNTPIGFGLFYAQNSIISVGLNAKVIGTGNKITNCYFGVLGYDNKGTTADISHNQIILPAYSTTSVNYGVELEELTSTPFSSAIYKVDSNTISDVNYGVTGINLQNATIDTNLITINPTGGNAGVLMNNVTKSTIIDNDITGSGLGDIGISMEVCPSASNFIGCNMTNGNSYGISFDGNQTAGTGTGLAQNLMTNNNTGLILNSGGAIGAQGNATNPNDNTWNGSFTYDTYCNNSLGSSSPFTVQNKVPYDPTLNGFSGAGANQISPVFANAGKVSCYSCKTNTTNLQCAILPLLLPQVKAIIANADTLPVYPDISHWLEKHGLYRFLKDTGSYLLSDSVVNSFYDSVQNANMGKIDSINVILADTNSQGIAEWNTALALNAAITPVNAAENTYQVVDNIILTMLINGEGVPDSTQAATLRAIAQECPQQYGTEVFTARAIMNVMDMTFYRNNCDGSEERGVKKKTVTPVEAASAKVYPNPANALINVQVMLTQGQVDNICIYNSIGEKVVCEELSSILTPISTDKLAAGIYFYRITDINGDLIKSDKVVIEH